MGSTDGILSSPSSRSTSSTRSAGCTRSGRQLGGVTTRIAGSAPSSSTRAPIWVSRFTAAPGSYSTPAIRSGRSNRIRTGGGRPVLARRIATPVGQPRLDGAAGDLGQQRRAAVECGHRDGGVHRTLVAPAGLADQMQSPHGARHRGRIPHRGLQQDVGGVVVDLGGARAHHAADGRGGHVVDDQHVTGIELALDVVEGDHGLPRFGEPHREVAVDAAAVVGVHRMAEFEHHVVGDVDRR